MKTKYFFICLIIFSLFISCKTTPPPTQQELEISKEPKTFLKIKWLDEDNAFGKGDCSFNVGTMLDWGVLGLSTYTCYLDDAEFGVVGSKQALTYYHEQFFMGTMFFEGERIYTQLLSRIYEKYGKPVDVFAKKDAWAKVIETRHLWVINRVLIQLKYDPTENVGTLSGIYTPISNKINRILYDKKRVDTWGDTLKIEDLY